MRKTLLFVPAALCVALCAGLGFVFLRAYRNGIAIRLGDSAGPALPPPLAGRVLTAGPQRPGYSNEQLHELLEQEASELGIQGIATRGESPQAPAEGFLGPRLGSPETRARAETAMRRLARLQRAADAYKKPLVPLKGDTVPLLSKKETNGEAIEQDSSPAAPGQEAPSAGSWSGLYGGTQEGNFTVADPETWEKVWRSISREPPPDVDFSRWQVAAVFLGVRPTGGFRAEISPSPESDSTAVTVLYREIPPQPGLPHPEVRTAPFALRLIPRTSLPVRFKRIP